MEEACLLFLRAEACFLEMRHHVVATVTVFCASAVRCKVAEAVNDLSAQEALRVLGEEWNAEAVLQGSSSNVVSMPVEEVNGQSTHRPSSRSRDVVVFEGDPVPLCGLFRQDTQCVSSTHIAWVTRGVFSATAPAWTGSLMPSLPFLLHTWARSQVPSVMGTWMMPPKHHMREACIIFAQRWALSGSNYHAVVGDWRRTSWATSSSAKSNFSRSLWKWKSVGPSEAFVVASCPPC